MIPEPCTVENAALDVVEGALALALSRDRGLRDALEVVRDALEVAVLAGARAVEHVGAQPPPR